MRFIRCSDMNGSLSFSFESLYEQEMSVQMYKQRKKQSYGDRMRLNELPYPKSPIFSTCCVTKILKATEARERRQNDRKRERTKEKKEREKSKKKPPSPKKKIQIKRKMERKKDRVKRTEMKRYKNEYLKRRDCFAVRRRLRGSISIGKYQQYIRSSRSVVHSLKHVIVRFH